MSPTNTTSISILTQLLKGDRRLKRLDVSIITTNQPDQVLSGCALVTELNDKILSFFCTQKFKIDEVLTLTLTVDTDELEFKLRMSHLHEQISSGRVMSAIPTEASPFPVRKFYRCFAEVLELKQNGIRIKPPLADAGVAPATVETLATDSPAPVETGESEIKAA